MLADLALFFKQSRFMVTGGICYFCQLFMQLNSICQACQAEKEGLLRCSSCKTTQYCSQECQRRDWKNHKLQCSEIQLAHRREQEKAERKAKGKKAIEDFADFEIIGHGNFSQIFKVREMDTNTFYAIKKMSKQKLTQVNKEKDVYMEKHCLAKLLENPYVIRMHATFQDDENLYMLLEYVPGGELWSQIHSYGAGSNYLIRYYLTHLTKAIHSLHSVGIVHRDIKSENVLLTDNFELKFIDFGTARDLNDLTIEGSGNGRKGKAQFKHFVGTPQFMAPECIRNKDSTFLSDVYSLGVLFYQIAFGTFPFEGESDYLVFQAALEGEVQFAENWIVEDELKDLIKSMLVKEAENRISLEEVMKHPYWGNINWDQLQTYAEALSLVEQNPVDKTTFGLITELRKVDKLDDAEWKKLEIKNLMGGFKEKISNEEVARRYSYIEKLTQKVIKQLAKEEQNE